MLNDAGVKDTEWAKREGFVAFAGYLLSWGGKQLGVLGMYSRHALTDELLLVMGIFVSLVSAIIALQGQMNDMVSLAETMVIKRSLLERMIHMGRESR